VDEGGCLLGVIVIHSPLEKPRAGLWNGIPRHTWLDLPFLLLRELCEWELCEERDDILYDIDEPWWKGENIMPTEIGTVVPGLWEVAKKELVHPWHSSMEDRKLALTL
jgi:hypothetical protein